jgi:hypothetical protein
MQNCLQRFGTPTAAPPADAAAWRSPAETGRRQSSPGARRCRTRPDVLRFMPQLEVSDDEIDEMTRLLARAHAAL